MKLTHHEKKCLKEVHQERLKGYAHHPHWMSKSKEKLQSKGLMIRINTGRPELTSHGKEVLLEMMSDEHK